MIIDDPRVNRKLFHPRKIPIPSDLDTRIQRLEFKINQDIKIGGFCFINDKSLPIILLFHGNGELALEYSMAAPTYFKYGVNLAVVDFRGYGFSTGQSTYSTLIKDACPIYEAFIKWLDENKMKNAIFLMGRSLGSVCAAEIGAHNPKDLNGIIFESGFGRTYKLFRRLSPKRFRQISPESIQEFSNDTKIKKFLKPVLVIHGTRDWIILSEEANIIYNAIPNSVYKKLILIEGATHNNISRFENEYFSPLSKFIQKFK